MNRHREISEMLKEAQHDIGLIDGSARTAEALQHLYDAVVALHQTVKELEDQTWKGEMR